MRDPSTEHPDPEPAAARDGSDTRTRPPRRGAPEPRRRSSWCETSPTSTGVFRCALHGEIDFSSREQLDELARAFVSSPCAGVRVDVSTVTFVDSTALALLLELRRVALDRGGQVVLVRPGRRLRRLLTIAGMTSLFAIDGSSTA